MSHLRGRAFRPRGQQQAAGTVVEFWPVTDTDIMVKDGNTEWIDTRLHSITCMKEYESKSFEELRFEDYAANRKGQNRPGQFNGPVRPSNAAKSIFGQPPNAFGQPNTAKSVFGRPVPAKAFGQPDAVKNVFGQSATAFGQPDAVKNVFGQPVTAFGQPDAVKSVFGQPAKAFGQVGTTFGKANTGFRMNAQQQQAGEGLFGKPAGPRSPIRSANVFRFGANTETANSFGNIQAKPFGSATQQSPLGTITNMFGKLQVKNAVSMKAFIISDKTLQKLICNSCNKYLSVLPVKIYRNGDTKCGRCAAKETPDNGVLSLIGLIGDYCLFKCINRFDGCRELLPYSQVKSHEKTCISKLYQCPVCQDGDAFTSLLLERHFRTEHEMNILVYPQFTINLTALFEPSVVFFYIQEDFLFFISFRYNHSVGEIRINISLVGTLEQAHKITRQCWITSPDNQTVNFVSKKMLCTNTEMKSNWFCIEELDVDNTKSILVQFEVQFNYPQWVQISNSIEANGGAVMKPYYVPFTPMVASTSEPNKIHLTPDFLQSFPDVRASPGCTAIIHQNRLVFLKCKNCNDICWTGTDEGIDKFYICNKDQHSLCYCCFKYLRSQLKIEEADYISTTLSWDMLKKIRFVCRWGCGESFDVTEMLKHEGGGCHLGKCWSCGSCDFQEMSIGKYHHQLKISHDCSLMTDDCVDIIPLSDSCIAISFEKERSKYFLFINNTLSSLSLTSMNGYKNIKISIGSRISLALLFDSTGQYFTQFSNSITFRREEKNFFLKIIR